MRTCGTEHIDAKGFSDWFHSAAHGEKLIYATGSLAYACFFGDGEICLVRGLAQEKAHQGLLVLIQRPTRLEAACGVRKFDYIAVRYSPAVVNAQRVAA